MKGKSVFRAVAVLLVAVMCISFLPMTALAEQQQDQPDCTATAAEEQSDYGYWQAISDAQEIADADQEDTTQIEVDNAVSALTTALGIFNDVKAAGTKENGPGSLEVALAKAVAWYQTNCPSPDYWEGLPALWGVGENLNVAPWGTGQGWRENDPGFAANATGNDHIYYIFRLLAVEKNPANVWNGRNLFKELAAQQRSSQAPPVGAFGDLGKHIWAVVLLDIGEELGVDVGNWANTQSVAISHLLNQQKTDGSFGDFSQLDYTGWALTALSNHREKPNVQEAIGKAVTFLHSKQQDNAGFALEGDWGKENCNSNAAVISGLVAVGEDVLNPEGPWLKNDQTVLGALLKYQQDDGSFWYKENTASGVEMNTAQALMALADLKHNESTRHRMGQIKFAGPQRIAVQLTVEGRTGIIFPAAEVEVQAASNQVTALDVLKQGLDAKEISYELQYYDWGVLVNSIAGEESGFFGGWDGWVYTVNGVSPDVGAAGYIVQENDEVFFYYSRWPVLSSETIIDAGEADPRVEIDLVGDEYADEAETKKLDNWTIDTGESGLSVESINKDADQKVTIAFTGTAAPGGKIGIRAGVAALRGDAASEELILRIKTTEPVTYILTLIGEGLTAAPDARDIEENTALTITVTAPAGKQLDTFTVNGEDKNAGLVDNKYTFNIIADTIIKVTYAATGDSGGESKITVTFKLTGDSGQTWLSTTSVEMPKGAMAFDVFDKVLSENSITYRVSYDSYVSGIEAPGGGWLSEFDKGPLSGWMYKVNGVFPGYSSSLYALKDNDNVEWVYTRDLGEDVGGDWGSSGAGGTATETRGIIVEPAATGSGNTASATVTLDDIKEAIGKAKGSDDPIVIVPKTTGTVSCMKVELGKDILNAIVQQTGSDLIVETPVGNITLPNDALSFIVSKAGSSTVTMNLEAVEIFALTPLQQEAVGNSVVFDISITSGSKAISSFDGQNVTISLPYTLKEGESSGDVKVWHLNDNGELEQMTYTYDAKTGLATFSTSHLSYYLVGVGTEKEKEKDAFTMNFTDVKEGDWFYKAVQYAMQDSLFVGTSETTFSPNQPMTRAMLVTVLHRLEGLPAATGTNNFTDVRNDVWYTTAVTWADANGIVSGYGKGLFGPSDPVTREQMAAILLRYASHKDHDVAAVADLNAYTDAAEVSSWAQAAMSWANARGLITGCTATALVPGGTATRAEVASILMRFVQGAIK